MGTVRYWFPAKRYGWGWGLPVTWQGWIVLLVWFAALMAGVTLRFAPHLHPIGFVLFLLLMTTVLMAICYAKGEPPRWRWGDRE
jgi:hypothetical protein